MWRRVSALVLGLLLGFGGLVSAGWSLASLFPTAAASATITAQGGSLSFQGARFQVPPGAVTAPATLTLYTAPSASFPVSGAKTLFAFALQVTDQKTGQVITTFAKPFKFSYIAPGVDSASRYLNVLPNGRVVPNPVAPTITGDILVHPIAATAVGWLVTGGAATVSPASLPPTGLPNPLYYLVGGALLIGSGVLLSRRKGLQQFHLTLSKHIHIIPM